MIAIAGGKGGCGKTTTTVGLAREFVAAGQKPLLVDADVDMPDLHQVADVEATPGLGALSNGTDPQSLLQSSRAIRGVDVVAAGSARPPLTDALAALSGTHRPLLIDCPAGASADVAGPLRQADRSIVVSTATAASLAGATKTAAMARALDTPPVAAVIRGEVDRSRIRAALECGPVVTVPDVNEPLNHADVRAGYKAVVRALSEENQGVCRDAEVR